MPAEKPKAAEIPAPLRGFLWFALIIVGILSYARGFRIDLDYHPSVFGKFHFYLDYSEGFIRRGLAGEIIRWFAPKSSVEGIVFAAHHTLAAIFLGLLLWSGHVSSRQLGWPLAFAMLALVLASQLLPTLAFHAGYLDIHVTLAMLVAALAIRANQIWPAVFILAVLPFAHEQMLFYWLPVAIVLCAAAWQHRVKRTSALILVAAPVAAMLFIVTFSSEAAVQANLARVARMIELNGNQIDGQLLQTIPGSLSRMADHWLEHWPRATFATIYLSLPAAVMLWLYAQSRQLSRSQIVLLAIATFSPISILSVASDLSRLVVVVNVAALVVIALFEKYWQPVERPVPHSCYWIAGILAVLAFQMPLSHVIFINHLIYDNSAQFIQIVYNVFDR